MCKACVHVCSQFSWAHMYVPGSITARSRGHSVSNILRNCPSCPQWLQHLTHPPRAREGSDFSISRLSELAIPFWRYAVAPHRGSICVPLVARIKRLSVGLLAVPVPSLEKCLFRPFAPLFTGLFVSLLLRGSLPPLNNSSLPEYDFPSMFSHFVGQLSAFLMASCTTWKVLI